MKKRTISGPALFMYIVIAVTVATAAVCFALYYGNLTENSTVLWVGIVSFMIVYHFWGRILLGNVSKLIPWDHNCWWFREKPFEKRLYGLLSVKKWKGKALTFDPESFNLRNHSLDEVATVMTKSEADHWINELISLFSILFALLWGELWIFALTAVLAMLFDAQFIVIQRYNRPRILKILNKQRMKSACPCGTRTK